MQRWADHMHLGWGGFCLPFCGWAAAEVGCENQPGMCLSCLLEAADARVCGWRVMPSQLASHPASHLAPPLHQQMALFREQADDMATVLSYMLL